MGKTSLGEFELIVLLAVLRLEGEAYGVPVAAEIESRTGRRVVRGALYVTLERLVDKGHLLSRLGDSPPGRGGRPRRYYTATKSGRRAARAARDAMRSMWAGLGDLLEDA